jgi:hypothetical protein
VTYFWSQPKHAALGSGILHAGLASIEYFLHHTEDFSGRAIAVKRNRAGARRDLETTHPAEMAWRKDVLPTTDSIATYAAHVSLFGTVYAHYFPRLLHVSQPKIDSHAG